MLPKVLAVTLVCAIVSPVSSMMEAPDAELAGIYGGDGEFCPIPKKCYPAAGEPCQFSMVECLADPNDSSSCLQGETCYHLVTPPTNDDACGRGEKGDTCDLRCDGWCVQIQLGTCGPEGLFSCTCRVNGAVLNHGSRAYCH